MKKSNITGWKDVFTFTLFQALKSKAYRISYFILVTLVLISMPLLKTIITGFNQDLDEKNPIEKIYLINNTSFSDIDFSFLNEDPLYSHIKIEEAKDLEGLQSRIEEEENLAVILDIMEEEFVFLMEFTKASKGAVKDANLRQLSDMIVNHFGTIKTKALGITDEQNAILSATVETNVRLLGFDGEEIIHEDTSISHGEYWFIYGILFLVLMVNVMTSSHIASSIVTEKSTRVVETLLISIKPLALIVGKTIAMLLASLIQLVSIVVAMLISNSIATKLFPGESEHSLSTLISKDIFQNFNMINIIICFLLIILGMIFYATLAGLAGATVSRIEEMTEGLTLFTFTNLIGVYTALGAANVLMGSGINGFVIFSFLFPLSAPFILPGAILIGKVSLPMVVIAFVFLLLFIILLFRFVAKVYETLILHTGNTIKLKELLYISKNV